MAVPVAQSQSHCDVVAPPLAPSTSHLPDSRLDLQPAITISGHRIPLATDAGIPEKLRDTADAAITVSTGQSIRTDSGVADMTAHRHTYFNDLTGPRMMMILMGNDTGIVHTYTDSGTPAASRNTDVSAFQGTDTLIPSLLPARIFFL